MNQCSHFSNHCKSLPLAIVTSHLAMAPKASTPSKRSNAAIDVLTPTPCKRKVQHRSIAMKVQRIREDQLRDMTDHEFDCLIINSLTARGRSHRISPRTHPDTPLQWESITTRTSGPRTVHATLPSPDCKSWMHRSHCHMDGRKLQMT